jgi:FixJ family two-component response regulator
VVTGHSDKDVVLASLKVGAAGFVVKPLVKDVLIKKIGASLDSAKRST